MYNQFTIEHKAPHQKAGLVERCDASIRSALERAEAKAIKESLCISSNTVSGLASFIHNAFIFLFNRIPHHALLGCQPHFLPLPPALEGGCHVDLDVNGQNDFARVRDIAAASVA